LSFAKTCAGDQRRQELAAIADHHRLGHQGVVLERGLDVLGRDVLAAGGDDDLLLAAGDRQEALASNAPRSPECSQPSIERLGGGLGLLEVAEEHVGAAHQDLAVVGDLHLDPGRRAHRAEPRARPAG
jgi:hypothetical protein